MGYDIIVADPPWKFASNSEAKPARNAMRHYPCMKDAEIAALPIQANKDCLLFMWTTAPMLARTMPIIKAWGFKYVSNIVWVKDRTATGYWVRGQHEHVFICKRGKFPCPRPAPFATSVMIDPRGRHSEKPSTLQDRIDEIWPEQSKLEMFARRHRSGWDVWGNEVGDG